MARSISFTIGGAISTLVTITEIESADMGQVELLVTLTSLGTDPVGDLGALFLDIDTSTGFDLSTLGYRAAGDTDLVTNFVVDEDNVADVGRGQTVKGGALKKLGEFDVGLRFGNPGIATEEEDIREISSFLTSDDAAFELGLFEFVDAYLRYTSVGAEGGRREDSLKVPGELPVVAENDELTVPENESASLNLILT